MANALDYTPPGSNDMYNQLDHGASSTGGLIIGYDSGASDTRSAALRFDNVIVPGSSVSDAALRIYVSSRQGSGNVNVKVEGFDEDDTADFSSSPGSRTKTSASNTHSTNNTGTGWFFEISVTSIVSEIVARGGWSSGNAIGFWISDNGTDTGETNQLWDTHGGSDDSTLTIRVSALPDFTPTPVTKSTPSLPSADSYGIKISKPGENVLTATEANLYFSTKKKIFKVYEEAEITMASAVYTVTHNLGYKPYAEAFVQSGDYRIRLPNISFTSKVPSGYLEITSTQLKIYATNGVKVYYYIFLDEMAT